MAKKNKARRDGVQRRVAEREIAAEPGMYEPKITGEDLMEYRDVAAAFPPDKRNTNNSWEVHQMLMDHPGRFDLIKQPWTEASLAHHLESEYSYVVGARDERLDPLGLHRSVADVIRSAGPQGDDVEDILLDMESKGLIEALPSGEMLVKGTRQQLMAYGIDPTDRNLFVDQPPQGSAAWRRAEQEEINRYLEGFANANPDIVLCHDPQGGKPMLFPRSVLAEARAAGETWVEYTEEEMQTWRTQKGDRAAVNLVLKYNPNGQGIITTKPDLDEAWARSQREVEEAERKLGVTNKKIAYASASLLAATEDAETPGWTLQEITEHLGVGPDRAARIIDDLRQAGHLDVHERSNGEPAFRLNVAGAEHWERQQKQFDEDDPRFLSKQWFNDVNIKQYKR